MKRIYADNAATTKICGGAKWAMMSCMSKYYGNPSSLHEEGQKAAERLNDCRRRIAKCINAEPEEIIFTSGGTEANNLALKTIEINSKDYFEKRKSVVFISSIEHPSILNYPLNKTYYPILPDQDGVIQPSMIMQMFGIVEDSKSYVSAVSVMMVNNETGVINDIKGIASFCNKNGILVHTDAVQAAGHISIDVKDLGIDLLSMSAHKFGGPRGVGALYCNKKYLHPAQLLYGGHQEMGVRAGTENLPAIVGMTVALEECLYYQNERFTHLIKLRELLENELNTIPNSRCNTKAGNIYPGIINWSFDGVKGEELQLVLDTLGVAVSTGSACSSGELTPSHVLKSMQIDNDTALSSIRISLSHNNTEEDVLEIGKRIKMAVANLRGAF